MFKGEPNIKALSNIKTSERRKMFAAICQDFKIPKDQITLECERSILPATIKSGSFKSTTGVSGTVYTDDAGVPLWFKPKDQSFIPTVYTLWKCPGILPMIYTHDAVVDRLLDGANLMLPGTHPPFDSELKEGRLAAVGNINNPNVTVAVGYCSQDLAGIEDTRGRIGVAVKSLHYIDDHLFKMPRRQPPMPSSESLTRDFELKPEDEESTSSEEDDDSETEEEESDDDDDDDDSETEEEESDDDDDDDDGDDDNDDNDDGDDDYDDKEEEEEDQEEGKVKKIEESNGQEESVEENTNENDDPVDSLADETYQLTLEDIDEFFVRSLLQSITQDKIELPITSSNFVGNHILKNLPQVDPKVVNMKKTSWKKSAKFLKAMEKLGLLKVKGKGDDLTVTSLATKDHERVKKFEPYKIKKAITSTSSPTDSKNASQLQAIHYFKPVSVVKNLLREIDVNPDAYFTTSEVKELLNKYIALKKLVNSKNKKQLFVNDTLKPIVMTSKELKGTVNGVAIYLDRVKVADAFVKNGFSVYHSIIPPGQDAAKVKKVRGEVPKITIVEEVRIGRKTVTRVFGFSEFGIRADDLTEELRVKCSGSATIGKNPQNPKYIEVMVQGAHFKIVSEALIKKGVKSTWIEHDNRIKAKKRRGPR